MSSATAGIKPTTVQEDVCSESRQDFRRNTQSTETLDEFRYVGAWTIVTHVANVFLRPADDAQIATPLPLHATHRQFMI